MRLTSEEIAVAVIGAVILLGTIGRGNIAVWLSICMVFFERTRIPSGALMMLAIIWHSARPSPPPGVTRSICKRIGLDTDPASQALLLLQTVMMVAVYGVCATVVLLSQVGTS